MARALVRSVPSALLIAVLGLGSPVLALPDLTVDIDDVNLQHGTEVSAHDVEDGCAHATTGVDVLGFTVATRNLGDVEFSPGTPQCPNCWENPGAVCANDQFWCAPSHGHEHYRDFQRYELVDAFDQVVATSAKLGWCLSDGCPFPPGGPPHSCDLPGLYAGCTDYYFNGIGCQYLDVTGIPDGPYKIRVTVDPLDKVEESDESNNVAEYDVTLSASDFGAPQDYTEDEIDLGCTNPFPAETPGSCLPTTPVIAECENGVARRQVRLAAKLWRCRAKFVTATFSGDAFDLASCELPALADFEGNTAIVGCPCVNLDIVSEIVLNTVGGYLRTKVYCAGTWAQDDNLGFFVPPDRETLRCEIGVSKHLARLMKRYARCQRRLATAAAFGGTFDVAACESAERARFSERVAGLPCLCQPPEGVAAAATLMINSFDSRYIYCMP